MDRSQLRKLSKQYAMGELEQGEYRRLREELIDAIVGGKLGIVREPTPKRATGEEGSAEPETSSAAPKRSLTPAYVIIGIIVVSVIVWLIVPEKGPRPLPSVATTVAIPSAPAAPGPGERLIEELLADNDWSSDRISTFELAWSTLTQVEREEAKGSRMHARLGDAIQQEINAQQALADLDPGALSTDTAERVLDLGRFLEMSITPLAVRTEPAESAPAETPGDLDVASDTPPAASSDSAEQSPSPSEQSPSENELMAIDLKGSAPETPDPIGEAYTLQLYAMGNLENAQKVMAEHPELDLELYDLGDSEPRYRILYGRYASTPEAIKAYQELPISVREDQAAPVVKSRRELTGKPQPPAAAMDVSTHERWISTQRDEHYTIQLFAVNGQAAVVEQFVLDYPELNLKIQPTRSPSKFHILYGVFESREQAEAAFNALPVAITRHTSGPVVKSFAELRR